MVHPRLNHARRFAATPPYEPDQTKRVRYAQTHAERADGNVESLNFSACGADIRQREDFRFEDVPINLRKQLEEHRLCAADGQVGDQVQDLDHSRLPRTCEVVAASLSRSNS